MWPTPAGLVSLGPAAAARYALYYLGVLAVLVHTLIA
jgi:hypothetical protein